MSTIIKGVEKDFLLDSLCKEQVALTYIYNRVERIVKIGKITKNELIFKSDTIIAGLTPKKKINLSAEYRGVAFVFVVEIDQINDKDFTTKLPETLYKNQDRVHPRLNFPNDIQIKFTFQEDGYLLPISDDTQDQSDDILPDTNLKTFENILEKLKIWTKKLEIEHKMVLFKDIKPTSIEESIITKTGKALFLPSTKNFFPETDPDPKKRIVTTDIFLKYLDSIGVLPSYYDAAIKHFVKSKEAKNIYAEAWIPLRFKEYTAGYIHVWTTKEDNLSLEYETMKILFQYANSMVKSLKESKYFDHFALKDRLIAAQGEDISAGGVRFRHTHPFISSHLNVDNELLMKLISTNRTLNLKAKIIRRYEEKGNTFFGCQYYDAEPEDMRFLYEYIYGKPFTN